MRLKRPPVVLVYGAAVAVLLVFSLALRERANAPAAPPPMPGLAVALTEAPSPISAAARALPTARRRAGAGTAFSVSEAGVWITAAKVVDGCRQAAILVAPGRGVPARVFTDPSSDLAVLTTEGGAAALPLASNARLTIGQRGFQPGYPEGRPGEATTRLLGRASLRAAVRGATRRDVLVWAEVGRTDGLRGLDGLSGAPVLDRDGRVVAVTLAQAPRRGRLYAAPLQAVDAILARAGSKPSAGAQGLSLAIDNYGRVADDLRRNLRVAQAGCIG